MLTPREFKRTRAARPRPDLGGDDLADLGPTCWCVGRFSTDKHLSIGKAHAVLPKIGLYWPPVVARVGRRPWRCRCGLPYWWPPVLADAVAVRRPWRPSVWLAGVLAGGPCRWCPSAVLAVGPWWCPSVAVVAVFVARGGLSAVRWSTGPPWSFRGPWRPVFGPCVLALSVGSVPPPLVARRRWCAVLVLACLVTPSVVAVAVSLAVLAGVAGVGVIAPCRGPWSVSLAASMGRRVVVCWWCHCAVPCWAVCRGRPSVLVSAVVGRWPSVRPCWCAGVRSVAGVRFLPCSVAVAALSGRRWCWCPSLVLAARVGLVLGLADWLAVWALPVAGGGGWRCLRLRWCLPCQ